MTGIDYVAVNAKRDRVFIYYALQVFCMALLQRDLITALIDAGVFTLLCLLGEWCMDKIADGSCVYLPFFIGLFVTVRTLK